MEERKLHIIYAKRGSCKTYHVRDQEKNYVYDEYYVNDKFRKTTLRATYPAGEEGKKYAEEEAARLIAEQNYAE